MRSSLETDRRTDDPVDARRIVVGLNRSPAGIAALRWAVGFAREDPTVSLEAVRAEKPHVAGLVAAYGADVPLVISLYAEARADEQAALENLVREVGGSTPIRRRTVHGSLAFCLLEAAQGASMLVLGHGGGRPSRAIRRCRSALRERLVLVGIDGLPKSLSGASP